ncbi:hypothetical protein [Helicobacter suis]|uniref:hypothetical protein n=1 Tax=Helicobacter suis TaxID=104628 RepID=UPI0015965DFC|nr:hypothetical protein [Helicobacter suis]
MQRLQAEREADLKEHTKELEMLKAQNTAILDQLNQLVAQFAPPTQQERTATIQAPQEPSTPTLPDEHVNFMQTPEQVINAKQPDGTDNSTLENKIQDNTIQENTTIDNTATHNTTQDNIKQDNTATATEDTTPIPPNEPLEHKPATAKQREYTTHQESKPKTSAPAPNERVISSGSIESTSLGEDHERSEHRGVYAGDTKQYGDRQGRPMVGDEEIVGEVGETSPRVEPTAEGILLESGGGGDERASTTLRLASSETEHSDRLREGDGAQRGAEAERREGARGSSALSGGNPEGDLSPRAHAHPSTGVGDIEGENREGKSRALGATDVAIQPREKMEGYEFLLLDRWRSWFPHDLSSAPRHSVLHSARPNTDGVSDLGSHTGTDSARRGDNRYGNSPRSKNQSLSLFDHRPLLHREELLGVPAEGQGVDGTLQYESRGIGAPELNASEIGEELSVPMHRTHKRQHTSRQSSARF